MALSMSFSIRDIVLAEAASRDKTKNDQTFCKKLNKNKPDVQRDTLNGVSR